jgi:hypothetical protein
MNQTGIFFCSSSFSFDKYSPETTTKNKPHAVTPIAMALAFQQIEGMTAGNFPSFEAMQTVAIPETITESWTQEDARLSSLGLLEWTF